MDISLHWHNQSTPFVRNGEGGMAYKHRLGHQSNFLNSRVVITGLSRNINLKWKKLLTEKLKTVPFAKNVPCSVFVGSFKFEMYGVKSHESFVNNLANLILHKKNQYKDKLGVASKESILKQAKRA